MSRSRVFPFVICLFCNFLPNGIELTILLFLLPEVPNFGVDLFEFWLSAQELMPFRQLREVLCLMENLWPSEGSWEHEFHEDGSGIPGDVCMGDFVSSEVWALHLVFEPCELLPDFCNLGRTSFWVHDSFG